MPENKAIDNFKYDSKAAEELAKEGIEAEVIDLRTIRPLDHETIVESVKKTGRIILSSDACERGSILNDMARNISELCFNYLDAPAVVIGAKNEVKLVSDYHHQHQNSETVFYK